MFKILRSFALIAAVASIAGVGTYSYFSDTATSNNNTFSAGTVKVSLDTPPVGSLPFDIDNLAPGDTTELKLDVKNDGTLDLALVDFDVNGRWLNNNADEYVKLAKVEIWNGSSWAPYTPSPSNPPVVAAGGTLQTRISVELEIETPNTYQGQTYRADFKVLAVQNHNLGTIPGGTPTL